MILKRTLLNRFFALLLAAVSIGAVSSCEPRTQDTPFIYGTQIDSANYYFLKGWEEILDNGRWTESELAFRKAIEFDPDWLLGKSMIGRITRDSEERQRLFEELNANKEQAGADERLLLDVNMLSMKASNNRDLGVANTPESTKARMQLAERNFGTFARKYPSDDYFKAEYIEFLHANHGAQVALDSLRLQASARQMLLGFYLSYAADLELELGNIERAIAMSMILDETLTDPSYLSPLMVHANIYISLDSLQKASDLVDRVVAADSNHIIALGMQRRLRRELESR